MVRLAVLGLAAAVLVAGCSSSPEEMRQRGAAQFQVGNTEDARETLQQVLDQRPSDPVALYYMGRITYGDGFYERAGYYFRSAIDADPSFNDAREWLAKTREALDRARP